MKNFGWTLAWMLAAASAVAQSPGGWPQWGGPTRDFKVRAGRLAPWPASGPREIWSRARGDGYSAIAADGSTLFTQYRPAKAQVLSGRSWTVPTLVGTRVYVRDRTDIKALELGARPGNAEDGLLRRSFGPREYGS